MAEINVTKQMINAYRTLIGGNCVLTDAEIKKRILADLEAGTLPEGFIQLATDAQKTGYNVNSSNLFGYGFNSDKDMDMGISLEKTIFIKENSEDDDPIILVPFSPQEFVKELGLDINSGDGAKIYSRLSNANIDMPPFDIKHLLTENGLEVNFDNVSTALELLTGVSLRNEEEFNATEEQRKRIILQIQAANIMEHLFSLSAQWYDEFTDGFGLFGLLSEGLGYVANKLGIAGENHYQWADSCREWAERAGNLSALNPEKFQEEFKKVYAEDGKYGIEFDEEKFNKLLEIVNEDKLFDENGNLTQETKDAILSAFNFPLENPNKDTGNLIALGAGEALMLVATLGYAATTKGGQLLATSAMSTFSNAGVAIASKSVNSQILQTALRYAGNGVKLLGPAVSEGTKLATYTMATGTVSNVANRVVKSDSEVNSWEKFLQTEAMVGEGAKHSFVFGAFAGMYGATVTQSVVQRVSGVSDKVTTALADKFAKGAVDANEVFTTYLAKSVPSGALEKATVELAAFATDVVGFAAFDTAMVLVKNIDGFPDKISAEDVANLLWEEFKGQGYNLGQIKIISNLIMWLSGSRSARMASAEYLKSSLPQLSGIPVEQVGSGYRIQLRSGAVVECKNATEMISSINLMARGETALSGKFAKAEALNALNNFKNELNLHRNVLGFGENEEITPEKLKLRYRELAKQYHSDKGGNDGIMAEINLANTFFTQNMDRINKLTKGKALAETINVEVSPEVNVAETSEGNRHLAAAAGETSEVSIKIPIKVKPVGNGTNTAAKAPASSAAETNSNTQSLIRDNSANPEVVEIATPLVNSAMPANIKPKMFIMNAEAPSLFEVYKDKPYPHFNPENARLTWKAFAKTLSKTNAEEEVIYISNFDDPSGTIAGSSTLNKTLYTDSLVQCAAVAVVDKKNNLQSLIHVYPGYSIEDNRQIIEHILSLSNSQDLEISIVPGYSEITCTTVQFILDTLEDLVPEVSPKLYNFSKDVKIFNRGLILKEGKLYCCDSEVDAQNRVVNPSENITYCESKVKIAEEALEPFVKSNIRKKIIISNCSVNGQVNEELLNRAISLSKICDGNYTPVSGCLQLMQHEGVVLSDALAATDKLLTLENITLEEIDDILACSINEGEFNNEVFATALKLRESGMSSYSIKGLIYDYCKFENSIVDGSLAGVQKLAEQGLSPMNIVTAYQLISKNAKSVEEFQQNITKVQELADGGYRDFDWLFYSGGTGATSQEWLDVAYKTHKENGVSGEALKCVLQRAIVPMRGGDIEIPEYAIALAKDVKDVEMLKGIIYSCGIDPSLSSHFAKFYEAGHTLENLNEIIPLTDRRGYFNSSAKLVMQAMIKNPEQIDLLKSAVKSKGFNEREIKHLYIEYPDKANLLDELLMYKSDSQDKPCIHNGLAYLCNDLLNGGLPIDEALSIVESIKPQIQFYECVGSDVANTIISLYKSNKMDDEMKSFISQLELRYEGSGELINYVQSLRESGELDGISLDIITKSINGGAINKSEVSYEEIIDFIIKHKNLAGLQIKVGNKQVDALDYISDLMRKNFGGYGAGVLKLNDYYDVVEMIETNKVVPDIANNIYHMGYALKVYKNLDFMDYPLASKYMYEEILLNSTYMWQGVAELSVRSLDTLYSFIEKFITDTGKNPDTWVTDSVVKTIGYYIPEVDSFLEKYLENISNYSDINTSTIDTFAKLIKESPQDYYPIIEKYIPQIVKVSYPSNSVISNFKFLVESKVPDEIMDIAMTSENSSILLSQDQLVLLLATKPDFAEVIQTRKDLVPTDYAMYERMNTFVEDIGTQHYDVIKYVLTEKNEYGEPRFKDLYIPSAFVPEEAPLSEVISLDRIKKVAELKNQNGLYSFNKLSDVISIFKNSGREVDLFFSTTPPERELDAYTLYDRIFKEYKDVAEKYGCSTFKEFEQKIPTLPAGERIEAGKLLGQIKKQAIDTFSTSLSADVPSAGKALFLLSSSNGAFSAKDLDRAVKLFNEKPILRGYLDELETTGKISESFGLRRLEEYAMTGDLRLLEINHRYIAQDPVQAKKIFGEYLKLYDVVKAKAYEYVKNNEMFIHEYNLNIDLAMDDILPLEDFVEKCSKATKVIPFGKLSAIIHNESIIKIITYLEMLAEIPNFDGRSLEKIKNIFSSPNFKDDNDIKALIMLITAYQKVDTVKLGELISAIESENLTMPQVNAKLFSDIKAECGLSAPVTEKDLQGWDMEYMPYVLGLLNGGFNNASLSREENTAILKSLIKTSLEGGYWESLFDASTPNGARNIESAKIFKEENLSMDEFLHYDGTVGMEFKPQQASIEPIKISSFEDFSNMLKDPKIKPLFEPFLEKHGIVLNMADKTFTINGESPNRQNLLALITNVNKFINDNFRVIKQSSYPDVQDHFVARRRSLSQTVDLNKGGNVTVSLWKRDVRHDLFQGHYCQCCVSTDGINNHSIIETMGHTVDQIAELKDASGNTVGKVKMLFLKNTETGEPVLLANGFEIVPPYAFDNGVRDLFVEFMKKYSVAVAGKELPIYTGATYQKINYDDFADVQGEFQLLGKTPGDRYHLDSFSHSGETGSHPSGLDKPHNLKLKVMYQPEKD